MDCSLKLITPPEIEPVTLAEVKLHAHIDHSVQDSILEGWITTARMLAEDYQRRAFIGQMWEVAFDSYPETPIYLPRAPLIGVVSIKIYDYLNAETVLYSVADNPITTTEEAGIDFSTNSDFLIDTDSEPGRIGFAYNKTWPSTTLRSMSAVKIRFAAGYGLEASNVPATVKDAIMLYCTYRNENRAAEVDEAPKQFFNLLSPDRMYL
jgi:uncharacterized phiE125 gp8 family phage protein